MTSQEIKLDITYVQTARGEIYDFIKPDLTGLMVDDFASTIAKINRFIGWTYFPYSVAQHSVLLSLACPKNIAYPCLMHDLHEAISGDVARPFKNILREYRKEESKIEKVVHNYFNLSIPEKVYYYDLKILVDEKQQLLPECKIPWLIKYKPLGVKIEEWTWRRAYKEFMKRYEELKP